MEERDQLAKGDEARIRAAFHLVQYAVHQTALKKGWWEEDRKVPEVIALIHSELSEALEEYRRRPDAKLAEISEVVGKPIGFAVELADAMIRIFDLAEYFGIDLADALLRKHAFNQTRPRRHGDKRA